MCLHKYVLPWLRKCQGTDNVGHPYVEMEESINFKPNLTYFVPVKLNYRPDGKVSGKPVFGNGSGDFANLLYGDGFVELPEGMDHYPKGKAFKFISYR